MTERTDGEGVVGCTDPPVVVAAGGWPTPNAIEFVARCPSTLETVVQFTVYVPSGSVGRGSRSSSGFPGTASVGALSTCCPAEFNTWRCESCGSGGSVNVATISEGAFWSVAPLAGTED